MWIIPNTLMQLNGSLDTEEITSESKEFFQTCVSSLLVRSKPTRWQTIRQRWKRGGWIRALLGRIVKPSLQNHSKIENWISSLLPTPASHSVQRENEKEQMIPAIYGPMLKNSSKKSAQDSVFSKTSKDISALDSEKSLPIWLTSDTAWKTIVANQRGDYSARMKLAHHTRENECLSWRTPATQDPGVSLGRLDVKPGQRFYDKKTGRNAQYGLTQQVQIQNWQTPEAQNSTRYQNQKNGKKTERLGTPVKSWPTPDVAQAQKVSNRPNYGQLGLANHPEVHGYAVTREKMKKSVKNGPQDQENPNMNGKSRERLNPSWVEQLMNLEVGWTQIETELID